MKDQRVNRHSLNSCCEVAIRRVPRRLIALCTLERLPSVRQEGCVPGVDADQWMSMFDRTKVLFCSRRNLSNKAEQPIGIGAIDAADLLDRVQIAQPPTVKDQIVLSPHFRNSVDRKADELMDGNRRIKGKRTAKPGGSGTGLANRK